MGKATGTTGGQSWNADTIVKPSNPPPDTTGSKKQTAKANGGGAGLTVAMHLDRETKGTFLYASDDPNAAVTSMYVRKTGLPNGAYQNIVVTVRSV